MYTASFTTHRIGNAWFKIMLRLFPAAQLLLLLRLRLRLPRPRPRLPRPRPHRRPRHLLATVPACTASVEALGGLVLRAVHRELANTVMIGTHSAYKASQYGWGWKVIFMLFVPGKMTAISR